MASRNLQTPSCHPQAEAPGIPAARGASGKRVASRARGSQPHLGKMWNMLMKMGGLSEKK